MPKFDFNNTRMAKFFSSEINRNYLQEFINREGILRANYDWYLTQGTIATDVTPTDNKGLATFSVKARELKAATLMNLRAPLGEGYQKEKGGMHWYTATLLPTASVRPLQRGGIVRRCSLMSSETTQTLLTSTPTSFRILSILSTLP